MVNWGTNGAGATVATANAFDDGTRQRGHQDFMKRMVEVMIDEALDAAKVRSEQRAAVYWARNRAFAAVEEHLKNQDAAMEQVLALFGSDQIDLGRFDKLRAQVEYRRVVDAIAQSVLDVYAVLSPSQRRIVADCLRSQLSRATMWARSPE